MCLSLAPLLLQVLLPHPPPQKRHKFDGQTNPRIPGVWNVSITGPRPVWHRSVDIPGDGGVSGSNRQQQQQQQQQQSAPSNQHHAVCALMRRWCAGHLTEQQAYREDIGWQNRSAAIIDLDEMIGR